jgi:hypothetical protein
MVITQARDKMVFWVFEANNNLKEHNRKGTSTIVLQNFFL